ncbi:protein STRICTOSIDINE SYNTHASE-LIKE 10-like [Carica papaya]|uniref:protein STRICTOSIDINE SYNTHASE-LIKE 10-like n=1 Tax=Carica papaya TaxID=3649 RepID=UPI000B8CE9E3|nr:protein STRICTOSIDINE SYNTHASE-LIKE 10-like [Carica papaya]
METLAYFPRCLIFSLLLFLSHSPHRVSSHDQVQIDGEKKNYYQLDLPSVSGPESIAFDCNGRGPYVGVSDGRILRWEGAEIGWTEFAVPSINRDRKACDGSTDPKREQLCGRPLGLKFSPVSCDLYIADAYFGLLSVGPNGGAASQLATSADGIPFRLTNALDIDTQTGDVYFTDSSIFFQRREYFLAIIGGDKTGRLLKYDPHMKKVTVLQKELAFPNGVALSKDNSFVVVAETGMMRILKFEIHGDGGGVFAQLERYPDNIKRNDQGEFWVALNAVRGRIQGSNVFDSIPNWLNMRDPVAVKYDEKGNVVRVLDGDGGETLESVSEVEEENGVLYVGSVVKPYLGVIKN